MVSSANNHQKLMIFHKISKYFVSAITVAASIVFCSLFPVRIPLGYMFSWCSHNIGLNSQMHLSFPVRLGEVGLKSRKQLFWSRLRECQKNLMTAAIARTMCTWSSKGEHPGCQSHKLHDIWRKISIPISTLCKKQSEPKASREHSWTDVTGTFTGPFVKSFLWYIHY